MYFSILVEQARKKQSQTIKPRLDMGCGQRTDMDVRCSTNDLVTSLIEEKAKATNESKSDNQPIHMPSLLAVTISTA